MFSDCKHLSKKPTSFKIILNEVTKLVNLPECLEFFTSCGQSEKMFRTLRKVYRLCNFFQNFSGDCRIVGSQKKCLGHSESSRGFVTSFKPILKLVDSFTSCGQSEKCLGLSGRSTFFITSFKIFQRLLECLELLNDFF